jgi:hypothetical protein
VTIFNTEALKPADILAGRAKNGTFPKGIRAILNSYTNHNGLFIPQNSSYVIGEAIWPKSTLTPLESYEAAIDSGEYWVRVWRVMDLTDEQRETAAQYFRDNLLGLKYPISVGRLAWLRILNSMPFKIHSDRWCTALDARALQHAKPDCLDSPQGKRKKNWTPKTFENRLVAGVFEDVTRSCIFPSPQGV